ncbi:GNAT family N-acetyltransferase [Endozoicomonas arenosclerae]|uniref:GNAT family N-acetyltransferase n=1 Tax=Endozoicomonas arenosclerae TaxID=1633495 RepID=UPI000782EADB|nr:GNAT family N-acetyltransferase [Endozoicomonas arenosclerae]
MTKIKTARTFLTFLTTDQSELLLEYRLTNRAHLSPWEPSRSNDFYTQASCKQQIIMQLKNLEQGAGYCFAALSPNKEEIIGLCNFNNVVHGVFQACHLGYSVAENYQGKGYMKEVVSAGINHMFDEVGLHRIMANYIPDNHRSAALLRKLGFEEEGRARSYLKIAGKWQDHILTSRINPAHSEER